MYHSIPFCISFDLVWFCYLILLLLQNTTQKKMEMTIPVFTRKSQSDGEKMEMTTPVITKRVHIYIYIFFFPMPNMLIIFAVYCMIKYAKKHAHFNYTREGMNFRVVGGRWGQIL